MAADPRQDLRRRARALYLEGVAPADLAARLGLGLQEVMEWAAEGGWEARRRAAWSDPRGAARSLRRVLGAKVAGVVSAGEVDRAVADELAKIGATLARLEGAGYDLRAAAVEVSERLAGFAAAWEADPQRLAWLADLLDAFFASLE